MIKFTNQFILIGYKGVRLFIRCYRLFLRVLRRLDLMLGKFSPLAPVLDRLPIPRGMGYFLPEKLSLADFFGMLEQRNVRYVVLRWHEKLPENPQDGDIDLLIHDDDVNLLQGLFTARITAVAFDIYTASAQYGFTYKNLPYYPPHLAYEVLAKRQRSQAGIFVPSPRHYFLSLAYHTLYHKMDAALFTERNDPRHENSKYVAKLKELAAAAGFNGEINFTALDGFLFTNGWRPPFDTLRKLLAENPQAGIEAPCLKQAIAPDLLVFVVREAAAQRGQIEAILEKIKRLPLEIFTVAEIGEADRQLIKESIRGGEWGSEDFPYNYPGGLPVMLIVAVDHAPAPVSETYKKRYPFVNNAHTLLKHQIRQDLNDDKRCGHWANAVHCSDDVYEALDYLAIACPAQVPELLHQHPEFTPYWQALQAFGGSVSGPEPVLAASELR
ncbi:hypothetical protein [Methylomicrobium lacus]|uniref:hypothetical protein n=1 Tax=Methylomicrobium lacus TaxID=136992 RepID=UPI00045EA846|nr:hypothetical protein [Methylomicrobium lacus]